MQTLDFAARYTVKGGPRVAYYLKGYPQRFIPYTFTVTAEDGTEYEEEDSDGDWEDDLECGQVLAVMVGDDKRHTIDIDDLIPLDDLAYCHVCGQVGCTHDGRDRE
jgi:hypothetical protein